MTFYNVNIQIKYNLNFKTTQSFEVENSKTGNTNWIAVFLLAFIAVKGTMFLFWKLSIKFFMIKYNLF